MSQEPLEALRNNRFYEFDHEIHPKCPHCGTTYNIVDNEAWQLYDADQGHTIECPQCKLPFQVVVHTQYYFSTEDQPDYES